MSSRNFLNAVDRRLSTQKLKPSTESVPESFRRQMPTSGIPLFLQAKLTISQPDDPYEQEADRVAGQVMRMQDPAVAVVDVAPTSIRPLSLQRTCTNCEDEEEPLQRKAINGQTEIPSAGLDSVAETLGRSGQPLDANTRSYFEPRFGRDYSDVRIHTDAQAADSARSVNALAYTVGRDVVFSSGQYAPHSDSGKCLLAHELAHVSQQSTIILPYRDPKSSQTFNFGAADTASLVEDSFKLKKDKETKPWIELITVTFTAKSTDSEGEEFWVGTGTAKYYGNSTKLPDISLGLSGGPVGGGKTKSGTFTVKRIEGVGYMSSKYSGEYEPAATKGKGRRYSKDKLGNMNFAVFFYGGQALHSGPVDLSSHGCVHVDWTDETNMQQLNYHSVVGLTKVKVKYS